MRRDVRILAGGLSFLEGARWHDGRLYASDFYTHRVLAFEPDGTYETVATVEGQPSGLGWDAQERLLISSMTDRRLLRLEGGTLVPVADLADLCDGIANDMAVDREGGAYVGNFGDMDDLGRTSLIRVDPDGRARRTGGTVFFPNGICLSTDGRTLLVAETFVSRISAFDILPDGGLADRRDWAALGGAHPAASIDEATASGAILPDGMCLDAEGCLWVACPSTCAAYRIAEGGRIVETVRVEDQGVFTVCLGGEDGRTLFLCCAARLGSADPAAVHEATLRCCTVDVPAAIPA